MKSVNNRMPVILLSRVRGFGKRGDVINVPRGFFRNHLSPKKLASLYEESLLQQIKKTHDKVNTEDFSELHHKVIFMERQTSTSGTLFGSVTNVDICKEIKDSFGVLCDKKNIIVNKKIRSSGVYVVHIAGSESDSDLYLSVHKSLDEAKKAFEGYMVTEKVKSE